MKRSMRVAILVSSLILLTACSQKVYLGTPMATVTPLGRVPDGNITTNDVGGLDAENTAKAFDLIRKLRVGEQYCSEELLRLELFAGDHNKRLIDG